MSSLKVHATLKYLLRLWRKWWIKTILIIALFLIILRIVLSPVATYTANKYLGKNVPGYFGHVKCIHFAFYRGAYKIDSLLLNKVDSTTKAQTPFVSCQLIDLSVEWKSLFHGALVGKIKVVSPEVRFTKDKVEPAQVAKDTTTFRDLINIGMPLDINRVEIKDGILRYKDETSKPEIDIAVTSINALAENLSNVTDSAKTLLPSSIQVDADVYGGSVDVKARLNLLKDYPTFEVKAEVKELDLTNLNNFFKAYGKFTIDKGNFSLYAEAAAKDGDYKGYLKPLIRELHVSGPSNADENVLTKLWEHVLDAVAFVFKNHNKDQLATKVPFEGSFGKTHTNILYAIFQVLRNAFIEALTPSLDNEININSVGRKSNDKPGFRLLKNTAGDKTANDAAKAKKEEAHMKHKDKKKDK